MQRFQDIADNIARIERFTRGMSLADFEANEQALFAVQHALLIISEAAQKLGPLAVELCPNIPWPELRGLGNRLRHEYDQINVERLWLVIQRDLPSLKVGVELALAQLEG